MATLSSLDSKTVQPETSKVDEAWQGVAGLRLRLKDHVSFYQHEYRGEPWLILADESSENYFRFSQSAHRFLLLLDGRHTVDEVYQALHGVADSTASVREIPAKQTILHLIANLKNAELLHADIDADIDEFARQSEIKKRKQATQKWLRPLSVKFALLDPNQFLSATLKLVGWLFQPAIFFVWIGLLIFALTTSWTHWPALQEHWDARFTDPVNLLWLWLVYPVVKALHELGHAYATCKWGGVVHEMGIMFLVFFPVPYVDSSASHRFSSRYQRAMVSGAGIMVELALAALAMIVWANSETGLTKDLAFDVVMIGSFSTLLFNGNPLLRFDGYYILGDLIQIPNLGTRSNQYLGYLFKRYVLAMSHCRSPVTAKGERAWFVVYGISSLFYRVFITLFIAFWVAGKFFVIGVLLAIWALLSQLIYPALRQVSRLVPEARSAHRGQRLLLVSALIVGFVCLCLLVPVRYSTHAEGIISLPENAMIRSKADGVVQAVLLDDGQQVEVGEVLIKLDNPFLQTRFRVLQAEIVELQARQQNVLLDDRMQSEIIKHEIKTVTEELADVKQQLSGLDIVSPDAGQVSFMIASDLPGRYVKKGEVVGYLSDLRQVTATVVIPQSDINQVRSDTRAIQVKVNSQPAETLQAELIREVPLVSRQLPARSLGSQYGGKIAVDARDQTGMLALANVYQLEIALPVKQSGNYMGQRISVRFIHDSEALAARFIAYLQQQWLKAPFI